MYVKCWMNNYWSIYKTKVLTSFVSSSLRVKHIASSWALKLLMFIVLVFYNNLEMYSYLHNRYIVSQQATNFITTPSWKIDDTFELPTNHDMLQNIIHVFTRHPLPSPTSRTKHHCYNIQTNASWEILYCTFILLFVWISA
jgi:hypothetical protein